MYIENYGDPTIASIASAEIQRWNRDGLCDYLLSASVDEKVLWLVMLEVNAITLLRQKVATEPSCLSKMPRAVTSPSPFLRLHRVDVILRC